MQIDGKGEKITPDIFNRVVSKESKEHAIEGLEKGGGVCDPDMERT